MSTSQNSLSENSGQGAGRRGSLASASAELDRIESLIRSLHVEHWPTTRLRPNGRNARKHSDKQIAQLGASIRQFSFLVPIVVDDQGTILAGHGRWAAAKRVGLGEVPVIRAAHLSDEQKRLFVIADNRLAELAEWDTELLELEIKELEATVVECDLEITGFDTADLDRMLGESSRQKDVADRVPEPERDHPPLTQLGDLWLLGPHKLLCADACEAASYERLLGEERAEMVFVDPPYNVPIDGHVGGKGQIHHREFLMASGEMSEVEFTRVLRRAFDNLKHFSRDGSIHYACMDWRHIPELLAAGEPVYGKPKNLIVWTKDNAGMGTFYRSQHELVFVFKAGRGPHINNFGLGERGRYRTNVWCYPGVNTSRDDILHSHPTPKPVAMVVDAIKDCSNRGGIVLDSFAGSGTTILAAERAGRIARAIELDPLYCDVICRRWRQFSGKPAIRASDGRQFSDLHSESLANALSPPEAKREVPVRSRHRIRERS